MKNCIINKWKMKNLLTNLVPLSKMKKWKANNLKYDILSI